MDAVAAFARDVTFEPHRLIVLLAIAALVVIIAAKSLTSAPGWTRAGVVLGAAIGFMVVYPGGSSSAPLAAVCLLLGLAWAGAAADLRASPASGLLRGALACGAIAASAFLWTQEAMPARGSQAVADELR